MNFHLDEENFKIIQHYFAKVHGLKITKNVWESYPSNLKLFIDDSDLNISYENTHNYYEHHNRNNLTCKENDRGSCSIRIILEDQYRVLASYRFCQIVKSYKMDSIVSSCETLALEN